MGVAADAATGGTLAVTWEDCGDASTHGRITDLQPTQITIGQDGTLTGTGTIDEKLTDGSFTMKVTAGLGIKETYTGKACEAKTFNLPLNIGTVSWGGLDCPVSPGTLTQKVGFSTALLFQRAWPRQIFPHLPLIRMETRLRASMHTWSDNPVPLQSWLLMRLLVAHWQ